MRSQIRPEYEDIYWNQLCDELGPMLRVCFNVALIAAACIVTAAKLHSRGAAGVVSATQDVNRCLSVLRAAAATRSLQDASSKRTRRNAARDL